MVILDRSLKEQAGPRRLFSLLLWEAVAGKTYLGLRLCCGYGCCVCRKREEGQGCSTGAFSPGGALAVALSFSGNSREYGKRLVRHFPSLAEESGLIIEVFNREVIEARLWRGKLILTRKAWRKLSRSGHGFWR